MTFFSLSRRIELSDHKAPRFSDGESGTLLNFLEYLRESVIRKIDGVSEVDARRQLVPTGTNLLSLISHLTAAEVSWIQLRFAGTDDPVPAQPLDSSRPIAEHVANYRIAASANDEIVRESSLDDQCAVPDYTELNLRWVLVHLIEEIARHAGHMDIIREQIDGSIGR